MFKTFINFYKSQEPVTFWAVLLSSISALAIILFLVLNIYSLPPQLPLYYSLPWGEKQLVSISEFVVLPGSIVLISLVNLFISAQLHSSQLVIKRTLSVASLSIALILLVTALKIIYTFI
jgi:hypothetical protein